MPYFSLLLKSVWEKTQPQPAQQVKVENEEKEEEESCSSSSVTNSSSASSSTSTSSSASDLATSNSSPNLTSTEDQSSLTESSSNNVNSMSDFTNKNSLLNNASLIANVGLIELSGVSGMIGVVGNKLKLLKTTIEDSNSLKLNLNKNADAKKATLRASTPNCKSTNSTTNNSSWLNLVNNQSTIKTDPDSAPSLLRRHLMSSEFINTKQQLKNYPYKQQAYKQTLVDVDNDVEQILNRNKHVKRSVCFKKRDGTKSEKANLPPKKVTINNNQIQGY